MKKFDIGLGFYLVLAMFLCLLAIAAISEAYRIHTLVNSVSEDGKAICALTGNERTQTTTIIVGKLILPQTIQEEEYYCAPGKFYWVAK